MEAVDILVCEDERLFAMELTERLQRMGHRVVGTAASGAEAVELARVKKPNLALMDIRLEGPVSGTKVADTLAKSFDVPSIFVTAFADSETVSQAHRSHPLAYLVKPIGDRELEMAIEFGMAQHKMRETLRDELDKYRSMMRRLGVAAGENDEPVGASNLPRVAKMMDDLRGIVGHIAHHMNNSLAGVMGYLDWLVNCDTLQGFERRYVQSALEQCKQQKMFVQKLLWAAQEGPRELSLVPIRELVREVVDSINRVLNPDVEVQIPPIAQDLFVFADREAVKNSLTGVLVNADEAISGEGVITVAVDAQCVEHPQAKNPRATADWFIVIKVTDTGRGMSPDEVEGAFSPFASTRDDPRVAGLGLSVAYGVTQAHGGWVEVSSRRGKGTSVKLFLPQVHHETHLATEEEARRSRV